MDLHIDSTRHTNNQGGCASQKRKRILQYESGDDDFVNPPCFTKSTTTEQVKGKNERVLPNRENGKTGKNIGESSQRNLNRRFPPKRLTNILSKLNEKQKDCIKDIGFGSTLYFKVTKFSKSLAFWVVDNYDPDSNLICCNNEKMKVTRESVHDVYGIPLGNQKMAEPSDKKLKKKVITMWKSQFSKDLGRIRITHVLQKLSEDKEAGELFILNFLVVFVNVMIQTTPVGEAYKTFLRYIPNVRDIRNLDWCGLVIKCLKSSKTVWDREDVNGFYTRPVVFLLMLYLQNTKVEEESDKIPIPSISYWTDDLLEEREAKVIKLRGYGNVEVTIQENVPTSNGKVEGGHDDEPEVDGNGGSNMDERKRQFKDLIWEVDFNFKEHLKAKKKIDLLLDIGLKHYPESEEIQKRVRKWQVEFGLVNQNIVDQNVGNSVSNDDNSNKTPVHYPTKYTGIIHDDHVDEEVSPPRMTQLLSPVVFDHLLHGAMNMSSNMRHQEEHNLVDKTPEVDWTQKQADLYSDDDINDEDIVDNLPFIYVAPVKGKRLVKPTNKANSPYFKRVVDSGNVVSALEMQVSGWVFSGLNSQWDVVFENKFHDMGFRGIFESMIPGSKVHGTVVDIWATLLSDEERLRNKFKSPPRLFTSCTLLSNMVLDVRYATTDRYKIFESRFDEHINKYKEFGNLHEVQLVFFPIIKSEHFYLIVFNLKTIECIIIDNSGSDETTEARYVNVPTDLGNFFSLYLKKIKHKKARKFKDVNPERFIMSWMSKNNHVDCAIFLMRHTEMYKGEKMDTWDAGIEWECESQQVQLNELRRKYVAKILLSDLNMQKSEVLGSLSSYDEIPAKDKKKLGTKQHLEKIEARIKALN